MVTRITTRLKLALQKATALLRRGQDRYTGDFDWRMRTTRVRKVWKAALFDISDPIKKTDKLSHNVSGNFKILDIMRGTALMQRGDNTGRVSLGREGWAPTNAQPVQHESDVTPKEVVNKNHTRQTCFHAPSRSQNTPAWTDGIQGPLVGWVLWSSATTYRKKRYHDT